MNQELIQSNIVIIDYGMGNVGSIKNMLKEVGYDSEISNDLEVVKKAQKLILPGVGAFDNGMENIKKSGLLSVLNEQVLKNKIPVLGICLGMQLMTEKSEEGVLPGLGWIKGETTKFTDISWRIPHMGWNTIKIKKEHYLAKGLDNKSRFYFVHSYRVMPKDAADTLFETSYGIDFTSAFVRENIIGVQFHPEKSHKYGMQLLKNFAEGGS